MAALAIRVVLLALVIWWVLVAFGIVPSPFSRTIIRIRKGSILVRGAELSPRAKEHVADIIRSAMVQGGFITLSASRSITFSREVPDSIRQQIRNILLN